MMAIPDRDIRAHQLRLSHAKCADDVIDRDVPPMTYTHPYPCPCGAVLSIYNPHDRCAVCTELEYPL